MAEKMSPFASAVQQVLEAVIFENWLRFYFISEKPDNVDELYVAIPEQAMQRIQELYPHLAPLAHSLNAQVIDFDSSRRALCTYVATELDGKRMPAEMSAKVFDSATFQTEMQLFNTWVQAHEPQLDKAFMDFGMWRSLFAGWRTSDAVKEWASQLHAASLQDLAATRAESATIQ